MTASVIKEKLLHYIDTGDDKLLKLMYAMAKEYNDDDDFDYEFTEEEIKQLDERKEKRLSGISKTYTLQDAKDLMNGKKKLR